jgi:hypothetical protein
MAVTMRPKFFTTLLTDGTTVTAGGPIEVAENEEVYLWVRIAQGEGAATVAGVQTGEWEHEEASPAQAGSSAAAPELEIDIPDASKRKTAAGPTWSLVVAADGGKFKSTRGKRTVRAEATAVVRNKQETGETHVWWWENVELTRDAARADKTAASERKTGP